MEAAGAEVGEESWEPSWKALGARLSGSHHIQWAMGRLGRAAELGGNSMPRNSWGPYRSGFLSLSLSLRLLFQPTGNTLKSLGRDG